jgi:hypothetical protein
VSDYIIITFRHSENINLCVYNTSTKVIIFFLHSAKNNYKLRINYFPLLFQKQISNIVQGIRFDTIESLIGSRLIESSEGLPVVAEFYKVEDGFAFIVVQMAIARIPTGLQPTIAFDHSCQAANVVGRRVAAHKADTGYIVFVAIYQRQQHFATEFRTNILLQLPAVAAGATVRAVR